MYYLRDTHLSRGNACLARKETRLVTYSWAILYRIKAHEHVDTGVKILTLAWFEGEMQQGTVYLLLVFFP